MTEVFENGSKKTENSYKVMKIDLLKTEREDSDRESTQLREASIKGIDPES